MVTSPSTTPSVCFKVQKIIGASVSEGNVRLFQVQWEPTWVTSMNLVGCENLIDDFFRRQLQGENSPSNEEACEVQRQVSLTERNDDIDQMEDRCERNPVVIKRDVILKGNQVGVNTETPPKYIMHRHHPLLAYDLHDLSQEHVSEGTVTESCLNQPNTNCETRENDEGSAQNGAPATLHKPIHVKDKGNNAFPNQF